MAAATSLTPGDDSFAAGTDGLVACAVGPCLAVGAVAVEGLASGTVRGKRPIGTTCAGGGVTAAGAAMETAGILGSDVSTGSATVSVAEIGAVGALTTTPDAAPRPSHTVMAGRKAGTAAAGTSLPLGVDATVVAG
jgi:hypothetical protein